MLALGASHFVFRAGTRFTTPTPGCAEPRWNRSRLVPGAGKPPEQDSSRTAPDEEPALWISHRIAGILGFGGGFGQRERAQVSCRNWISAVPAPRSRENGILVGFEWVLFHQSHIQVMSWVWSDRDGAGAARSTLALGMDAPWSVRGHVGFGFWVFPGINSGIPAPNGNWGMLWVP